MNNKKRLAVIPARGGSKRIILKNIRDFCGRPIIAYTIESALNSDLFDEVIVSTDSEDIASIAVRYGAHVPFIRSASLADDFTPVSLVTLDTLEKVDPDGVTYEDVAQLMPNCPLRIAQDVRDSYYHFTKSNADAQISITRFGWLNPWWAMVFNPQHKLTFLFEDKVAQRSQDLPNVFSPTGAIWWSKAEVLRRNLSFYVEGVTGWEIPWQRAVDIDEEEDWQLAELLMRMREGL